MALLNVLLASAAAAAASAPEVDDVTGVEVMVQRSAGPVAGASPRTFVRSGSRPQDQAALRSMLDALGAMAFFSLPERLTEQRTAVRRDDGTVVNQVLRMADEPTTRVCVRRVAPAYVKCVQFTASAGPAALVQWADAVLAPRPGD